MNFNSPNPSFSLLSFVPWSGSHKIFVFNQLLFRLLLVTYFTYLVKCVLITIWLYTYSGRVSERRIRRCYVLLLGRTQNFSFFFHARDKTVTLLSFPFSYTNLSFLFKKQYCAKILRNKIHELFFHVILAASFPNIVDPWWNKCWKFNFTRDLRWVTGKGKKLKNRVWVFFFIILIVSCQEDCTWVRAMLETWHRVHIHPFSIIFVSVF